MAGGGGGGGSFSLKWRGALRDDETQNGREGDYDSFDD